MKVKVKEYQSELVDKLKRVFPNAPVETEWKAMGRDASLYCPRLDIAVGPFAYDRQYGETYNEMFDRSSAFIETITNYHKHNVEAISGETCQISLENLKSRNYNARCFLAIEIENKVSRKHLIGGAVNAAALGRIGLVIAWSPEKLKAFVKLRRYLDFLGSVGKNTFDTTNLLILDSRQFLQALGKGFYDIR